MVCRSAAHAAEAVAVSSGAASSARIDGRWPNGRTASISAARRRQAHSTKRRAAWTQGVRRGVRSRLEYCRAPFGAAQSTPSSTVSTGTRTTSACVPDDSGLTCADDATI